MNPLVIIPTYNERGNVEAILAKLEDLGIALDYLFVDDNSPDGTGELLDTLRKERPHLHVLHRAGKEGIGSAHQAGLTWAQETGYSTVVTMDCDLTHSPSDLPVLLKYSETTDVVVGSRYLQIGSLKGWNWKRKSLTRLAHALTRLLLGIPYDSTGAFRVYRFDRLPKDIFKLVRSRSYPFFFESLFILAGNGAVIKETPISLPPRTYGSSKMSVTEPFRGIKHLLNIALLRLIEPEVFRLPRHQTVPNPNIVEDAGWGSYWGENTQASRSLIYTIIATIYRRLVITTRLTSVLKLTFPPGAKLLHAGCGSGHVDEDNQKEMRITAVDFSLKALEIYNRTVPQAEALCHASIFDLPFADQSFDGIYHLGVIEHFSEDEIIKFLGEFRRVLKPDGRMVIFWPHARATSVAVLRVWNYIRKRWQGQAALHPAEISLAQNRRWVTRLLAAGGFTVESYQFGWRDFWVQAVVIAAPAQDHREPSL